MNPFWRTESSWPGASQWSQFSTLLCEGPRSQHYQFRGLIQIIASTLEGKSEKCFREERGIIRLRCCYLVTVEETCESTILFSSMESILWCSWWKYFLVKRKVGAWLEVKQNLKNSFIWDIKRVCEGPHCKGKQRRNRWSRIKIRFGLEFVCWWFLMTKRDICVAVKGTQMENKVVSREEHGKGELLRWSVWVIENKVCCNAEWP